MDYSFIILVAIYLLFLTFTMILLVVILQYLDIMLIKNTSYPSAFNYLNRSHQFHLFYKPCPGFSFQCESQMSASLHMACVK